ncbi:SWIM zinc finger family protein [Streptomyces shenzhenensis]|uniref:SWIM zinc finger family protein n=1 Tax=Streptomyces shenzhenensis TaxID=943815 RepID=UPI001F1A5096|nr:SWIM zinc finger family protein [Streptomyces shenzhenensis]
MSGEGEQRPGDAARRALRAAREHGAAETGGDGAAPGGGAGERPERAPRPGDAARLALRAAAAAKEAEQRDAETEPGGRPEAAPESRAGAERADQAGTGARAAVPPGSRPGDLAREALRAARAEARRAEEAAAQASHQSPARPARRLPSSAPATAASGRTARDLRQFLATAFQMPRDEAEPNAAEPGAGPNAVEPAARLNAAELKAAEPEVGLNAVELKAAEPAVGLNAAELNAVEPEVGLNAVEPEAEPNGVEPAAEPNAVEPEPRPATAATALTDPPEPSAPAWAPTPAPTPTPSPAPAPAPAWAPTPAPASSPTPSPAPAPASAPAPSATPRLPRTMATPHRDSELRRTFAALPSLTPRDPAGASGFAETWWGNAWVRALEEGALDVKRLVRGRGYAERGHVDAITVTPGLVLAYVQGSRPRPYRVQVRLRTFGEDEWERLLEAAADRPADIAALLDKELPQTLVDTGVPLLPGPGELEPRCSCPDFGHPCKHAAALCYQTARLLDADPFVLLLLRGRGEREVLDALSRRNAARAARERQPVSLPGVRATEAFVPRRLPPLPPPLPVPAHPEQPPVYPGVPGGPDPFALDQLATDAAARAHAVLATGRDPVGALTLWQDAVRLAAARPGSGLTASTRALYATLADAVGRAPGDLARAVAAWRQGGPEGLAVLEEPWDPPAGRFDRARPLLLAADLPAFRPWRNHLTHPGGHLQLRFGRDGLWYAYESEPGRDDWWPRGTPDLDPVGALTGLGAVDEL